MHCFVPDFDDPIFENDRVLSVTPTKVISLTRIRTNGSGENRYWLSIGIDGLRYLPDGFSANKDAPNAQQRFSVKLLANCQREKGTSWKYREDLAISLKMIDYSIIFPLFTRPLDEPNMILNDFSGLPRGIYEYINGQPQYKCYYKEILRVDGEEQEKIVPLELPVLHGTTCKASKLDWDEERRRDIDFENYYRLIGRITHLIQEQPFQEMSYSDWI